MNTPEHFLYVIVEFDITVVNAMVKLQCFSEASPRDVGGS